MEIKMKRLLLIILTYFLVNVSFSSAKDKFTTIAPQHPNQGWLEVVNREWSKKLDADIVIKYHPGAKDIPGANAWEKEYQHDHKNIMLLHGGNAESFLLDEIEYNYDNYAYIGLQNLTQVVYKKSDQDVEKGVKMAYISGTNPSAMSVVMMICGPKATLNDYLKCYNEKFIYVTGLNNAEIDMSFARGETNVGRTPPPGWYGGRKDLPGAQLWYSHGILDLKTGKIVKDTNFPVTFEEAYEKKWGQKPSGDFYDAYVLLRNYRDVFQRVLAVKKDNVHLPKLRSTLLATINDPESGKVFKEKLGDYPWHTGDEVLKLLGILKSQTTDKNLKTLVWWHEQAFKQKVVYKPELAKK